MGYIGVDIGTTHCKVKLFKRDGTSVALARYSTHAHRQSGGYLSYDPAELWNMIVKGIREVTGNGLSERDPEYSVDAIGIASMAESGILIDKLTGEARSPFLPWFEPCSSAFVECVLSSDDPLARFTKTGLHPSFKHGLPKLLWLKERYKASFKQTFWLSAADYIAFRLSGVFATDYTLAARTYAFDINGLRWDKEWLKSFDLPADLFPDAFQSGTAIGVVNSEASSLTGLPQGIPVSIAGHDHVVASLSVGATEPNSIYNSIGTAETLIGVIDRRVLGSKEYESGLSYGCHVIPGKCFWMGGISCSGGSVEWIRQVLSDKILNYDDIIKLSGLRKNSPTGILYYPFLSGSGVDVNGKQTEGAFIGLRNEHTRADIVKAVLEGTVYEFETLFQLGKKIENCSVKTLTALGGGVKNLEWLQIKADVTACLIRWPNDSESTLLGAAMLAGIASGHFKDAREAFDSMANSQQYSQLFPGPENHAKYSEIYNQRYLPVKALLQSFNAKGDFA